jgi:hypothetical protein
LVAAVRDLQARLNLSLLAPAYTGLTERVAIETALTASCIAWKEEGAR